MTTIRDKYRRPSSKSAMLARAAKARYAEELADVETAVSRAALLLRRRLIKAA